MQGCMHGMERDGYVDSWSYPLGYSLCTSKICKVGKYSHGGKLNSFCLDPKTNTCDQSSSTFGFSSNSVLLLRLLYCF